MTLRDLSIEVNGITFPNPFLVGSGPPGTNARVIQKAFDAGWGGAVAKTISLESEKVKNVSPRYGKLKASGSGEVIGFENIELISDRPTDAWLRDFKEVKRTHPDHVLIASIMEENRREAWQTLTRKVQDCGVDGLEMNLSCPHGMTERKMGQEVGQHPEMIAEVTGWVMEAASVPVWVKMTPNITDIVPPSRAAVRAGAHGISAINTILSIIGVDLETLEPQPSVEGRTVAGGYSCQAVRPIALRMIMELGRALPKEVSLCGIGGIERARDAIEFMLLGASTVQVCTAVMLKGLGIVEEMKQGLSDFLTRKGFERVADAVGKSVEHLSTHGDLVVRQKQAKRARAGQSGRDDEWGKGDIVDEAADHTIT